ncbi:MAG: hypothetical protein A2284_13790 [Deltaproteobacteria bacterium RIFOXYA12_FULL_61_11]|nr:MAG: hypothetical protein A2284_13790 [Deltaproteobacteria bacterium RIFOXYA12_FULL_61_11]
MSVLTSTSPERTSRPSVPGRGSILVVLTRIFPFLAWLRETTPRSLRTDLIAGVTVALVLIPQSMAYAQLAGLPAYFGLYAAFLPPMIAALFGSSRQLSTGPVAVVSLLTAAALEPLATAGGETYIAYAITLSLVIGLFQLLLGLLKLGMIVNFLSHPVVNGFTNAAAIIIATSQLSKLFGVTVDGAEYHFVTVARVVAAAYDYTHWPSFGLAVLAFGLMYGLKKLNPRLPFVLVAVVVTSVLSFMLGFEHNRTVSLAEFSEQGKELRKPLEDYNAAIQAIERTSAQRAELTAQVRAEEEQKPPDPQRILDLSHQLDLVNLNLSSFKRRTRVLRQHLRSMIFYRVEDPAGDVFHLRIAGQDPHPHDGRVWRLKVGNKNLEPTALSLQGGGAVVGKVPSGLPAFSLPHLDLRTFLQFLTIAMIISLLGFMEAISIAKAMAVKTHQKIDPNQELIGQGLANIVGSFSSSYAVSGSFSRSAVNIGAGAVSGLSSVFTSLVVVLTLLFFTPALYFIPESVLAAVIMMAVLGLINIKGFIHAYRAQRHDGIIALASFLTTLAFAPHLDKGIMLGVVLSIGHYLYRTTRPVLTFLSRHPDGTFVSTERHGLRECEHVLVLRLEGPLFFANVNYLVDRLHETLSTRPRMKHLIFVAGGINEIDASGEEALSLLIDQLRARGLEVSFCGLNEAVLDLLRRTYLYQKIGAGRIHASIEDALTSVHEGAHRGSLENPCPLLRACYHTPEEAPGLGSELLTNCAVLLVDASPQRNQSLARKMRRRGLHVSILPSLQERLPDDADFEVVVLVDPAEGTVEKALAAVHDQLPQAQVILLSGTGREPIPENGYLQASRNLSMDHMLGLITRAVLTGRTCRAVSSQTFADRG